jgi:protein-disulfide isomerase
MQRRHFLHFTSFAGLGVTAGTGLLAMSRTPDAAAPAEAHSAAPKTDIPDMRIGEATADVRILEYASFTCPHCATFHKTVMPRLMSEQINTGRASFTFREVYFDRPGIWASLMARAAGTDRYFAIADLLYERQREWTAGDAVTISQNLRKIGKIAGISDEKVDAAFADAARAEALVSWQEANIARDEVNSTPTVFVNEERLSAWDYDTIVAAM